MLLFIRATELRNLSCKSTELCYQSYYSSFSKSVDETMATFYNKKQCSEEGLNGDSDELIQVSSHCIVCDCIEF